MKTKELVFLSLLVGMGAVLHAAMPPLLFGMKPDLMLTMMFLGIMFFPKKRNVLIVGIVAGVIAAMTTSLGGGQLPNIIDKMVTAFSFFGLFLLIGKRNKSIPIAAALTAIGTIISGVVFLFSLLVIVGLPGTFFALFVTVVLPAALLNTVAMSIILPITLKIVKRAKIDSQMRNHDSNAA